MGGKGGLGEREGSAGKGRATEAEGDRRCALRVGREDDGVGGGWGETGPWRQKRGRCRARGTHRAGKGGRWTREGTTSRTEGRRHGGGGGTQRSACGAMASVAWGGGGRPTTRGLCPWGVGGARGPTRACKNKGGEKGRERGPATGDGRGRGGYLGWRWRGMRGARTGFASGRCPPRLAPKKRLVAGLPQEPPT